MTIGTPDPVTIESDSYDHWHAAEILIDRNSFERTILHILMIPYTFKGDKKIFHPRGKLAGKRVVIRNLAQWTKQQGDLGNLTAVLSIKATEDTVEDSVIEVLKVQRPDLFANIFRE